MLDDEISHLPLFADITDRASALVVDGGVTDVPAGSILAQAGEPGCGMFVVLDGCVTVQRGEVQLDIERTGFFGELALLVPDSPRIARVRAKTDARILAVPRETFDYLLDNEPSFTRALLREVAARLVQARTGN